MPAVPLRLMVEWNPVTLATPAPCADPVRRGASQRLFATELCAGAGASIRDANIARADPG